MRSGCTCCQPHYRSPIEYSDAAVAESVVALERIDNFVRRAGDVVGVIAEHIPEEFAAAMNDDLGTPAAVAVLHNAYGKATMALEAGETDLLQPGWLRSRACSRSSGWMLPVPSLGAQCRTTS